MNISDTYTLSELTKSSMTRSIVLKHLLPLGVDEQHLMQIHATLKELEATNMGGGIPYDVMQKLMSELDSIDAHISS